VLVLALVMFAVAATTVGVALAANAGPPRNADLGTANTRIDFAGSDGAAVAAAAKAFGTIEVIAHQTIAIPGSLDTLDVRAQDPHGKYGYPTLRLVTGRYPTGPGDIAMTKSAAAGFGLHIGNRFVENGRVRHLVGLVEDPEALSDEFALVAPGQANPPSQITVLLDAGNQRVNAFRPADQAGIETRGSLNKTSAAVAVLALETIGLLFVGLVAAAGFAVMAQRRLRAVGMLGALGATDRHVRFAMLTNGAVVGIAGSVTGALLGLASWIALAPHFEKLAKHRIDALHVPWWALVAAMILAVVTAIIAAWWPARAVSRSPIVAALSARPAPPKPAHGFAALGGIFLLIGLFCLAFADRSRPNTWLIVTGTVTTTFGMLFLGPLFIRALATVGRRAPIALRLALRDLARYQARSAAALGAISLALAIAATVAISAAALAVPLSGANLAANEAVVYFGPGNNLMFINGVPGVPDSTAAEVGATKTRVDALAASLHAQAVIPLTAAIDPASGTFQGGTPIAVGRGATSVKILRPVGSSPASGEGVVVPTALGKVTVVTHGSERGIELTDTVPLYVATPELLAHYGIKPGTINANTDIITSMSGLDGRVVMAPRGGPTPCNGKPGCRVHGVRPTRPAAPRGPYEWHATMQTAHQLPTYTSDPIALLTAKAARAFGLRTVAAGWLIQTKLPLTTTQINAARQAAADAGVTIETRKSPPSYSKLRNGATAVGLLVALGVLAMTVGLIRSETANELRTLAATGATSRTRRTLTGATAGALALLGALLGTSGAYAALLAWHRSDLHPLTRVPFLDLAIIIVGLPVIAITAGWLLAGREPPTIAHQPLD
jgi:putative ABC transport system permease protein